MYNLSIPQKTVGLFSFQNFDLHVLVGLSAYAALLQLARQENVRSLGRYSWRGMQPPETLPRSSRVASLLFQFPFRSGFGVRSEEHTSELQSRFDLVCRLL